MTLLCKDAASPSSETAGNHRQRRRRRCGAESRFLHLTGAPTVQGDRASSSSSPASSTAGVPSVCARAHTRTHAQSQPESLDRALTTHSLRRSYSSNSKHKVNSSRNLRHPACMSSSSGCAPQRPPPSTPTHLTPSSCSPPSGSSFLRGIMRV